MPEPNLKVFGLAKAWNQQLASRRLTQGQFHSICNSRILGNAITCSAATIMVVHKGSQVVNKINADEYTLASIGLDIAFAVVAGYFAKRAFQVMSADGLLRNINKKYGPEVAQDVIKQVMIYNRSAAPKFMR